MFNSIDGYGAATLVIVTADIGVVPVYKRHHTQSCIEQARDLIKVGFDALVFPDAVPDYIPLKDEAYV